MFEESTFPLKKSPPDFPEDKGLFCRLLKEIGYLHYEQIILVKIDSGDAVILHSTKTSFSEEIDQEVFSIDQALRTFLGKYCTDIDPEAVIYRTSTACVLEQLKDKDHYIVYYNLHQADGTISHKRILWHKPKDLDGYLCAVVEDLTGAFQYEDERNAQLKHALRDAQANLDANNTFLSLISRDIRTPLHSIIGLSRIANAELKDISAVESYLHKISMSGTYMEETINDIRDFIRISWHPIELRMEAIDLDQFATLTSSFFANTANERQLHFSCRTDGLNVHKVLTDSSALRQVIVKLTGNVLNYTLRGGSVELSFTSSLLEKGQARVILSIHSRGIDLDPDRLKILQQPYEYVMNEMRQSISSIDMDLVILRAYLNAMKGQATIETERGIRTSLSVSLTLPLASDEENMCLHPPIVSNHVPVPDLKGKRALLADDDGINLEVSTKLLENTGLTVFTAKNGLEAINLFTAENGDFDIILMDIRMPVMNGLDAARAIRELSLPSARTVPIIAMTVNAFDEDIKQSLRSGMTEHLIKPIEPRILYHVLNQLLIESPASSSPEI